MARQPSGRPSGRIGRYQFLEQLGEGSDAVVYRVRDRLSARVVALKALRAEARPEALERFRLEFARLAGLRHPRLLAVRDLGVAGPADSPLGPGQIFFTADDIAAETAREHFARLAPARRAACAARLLGEVAAALGAIHAGGLVHGDVKPDNILLGPRGALLCDLGLARARSLHGQVAGTPAYLAPEALGGEVDPRSDLWSLGVTLWELVEGSPPFGGEPPDLFRRILEAPPPAPAIAPPDLGRVLLRLLDKDPARRYARAEHVEVEAARLLGDATAATDVLARRPPLLPPAFCGREGEISRLAGIFSAPGAGPRVVAVLGPPGAGKTRLIREAVRLHQARAAAGLVEPRDFVADARSLLGAPAAGDVGEAVACILQAVDAVDATDGRGSAVLRLRSSATDPLADRLALARIRDEAAGALVVIEADRAPSWAGREGTESLELRALPAADALRMVESMAGDVQREVARDIVRTSGGLPGLIEQLLWARRAGVDPGSMTGVRELLRRRVRLLEKSASAAAEALAVLGRAAGAAAVARVLREKDGRVQAALDTLRAAGLGAWHEDGFALGSTAVAQAALDGLPARRARTLHERAAAELGPDAPARDRARHAEVLGPPRKAAPLALAAGRDALADLACAEAIGHLEFALRAGAPAVREQAALALAESHALGGDYARALRALDRGGASDRIRAERGRLLVRLGRYDEAESRLGDASGFGGDARFEARALLGRVALARGRPEQAREICGEPDGLPDTPGGLAMLEVAGLARLELGDFPGARACFERAEARVASGSAPGGPAPARAVARLRGLLGMVAQQEGDLRSAAARYAEACALAESAADVGARAAFAASLGAIDIERGLYGDALSRVPRAARELGRLGRTVEWASALLNHGNLLVRIGDLGGARDLLARARAAAEETGAKRLLAYAASLEGDAARAAGEAAAAVQAYRRAVEHVEAHPGSPGVLGEALLGLAASLRTAGRLDEATHVLDRAAAGRNTPTVRARIAVERARLGLAGNAVGQTVEAELMDAITQIRGGGTTADLWRAELVLALVLRARHDEGAPAALERARASMKEVVMATPDPYRDGLLSDPEARRLREVAAPAPAAPAREGTEARLRRLLAVNKRLNSETRLPRLLEYIVDTVIELCDAERGFLVLIDDHGGFQVRTARNITAQTLATEEFSLSRSIAEQAARGGQPIVTVDASSDERFADKRSVSALRLRSVLAAPLRVKGKVVGTIYVDHRLRRGAFSEDDVATVLDFADQAAIAVENARMAAELRRQAREIDRIRQELVRRVERQTSEIAELRTEVVQSREALGARYRYENLVGRSGVMRDLFALLDRVSATELPVVISGESGTGKELVARAIHANGPRQQRAFVSESCSAIPETLLESILFGHVRGAFTGADRDRRGLFEVADGGTLFLDEVGEMSAAMQAKLLRVVQEGEFRRVGGEQPLRASVRLLAASNRDLGKLVSAGRFREDLYYRLTVVRVDVPPLRERREDIPLLCEHLLEKHFPGAGRSVTPDAMRALSAYRWPGNVRELENVLLRAAALSDGPIRPADLPAEVQPGAAQADPDDLRIRTRVADLERDLIRRALQGASGNQSHAARVLGISRFGLHKKMQRFRLRVATSL
jgi:transcriptional regulator with GAF, ATPase, and Fis domain/tetratricopeptide (TPR) repeat protein